MHYRYRCRGVCAMCVDLDLIDGKLYNVEFLGGCEGNHNGLHRLVEGRDAAEIAGLLAGTTCGPRNTSCPDQLSKAIREALAKAGQGGEA